MASENQPKQDAARRQEKARAADEQPSGREVPFKFAPLASAPEDSYADGAAGIAAYRNVLKLDLYRVVGFDQADKKEVRAISHRFVLPLSAIPELLQLLQGYGQAVQRAAQDSAAKQSNDQ